MVEEEKNSDASVSTPIEPATGPAKVAEKSDGPKAQAPSPTIPKTKYLEKLKKAAWRTTAAACWLWWLGRLVLGSHATSTLSAGFTYRLISLLSSFGFQPVHRENLGKVLKIGWLLTISGFKPLELFGLAIYIVISPLFLFLYLVFKEIHDENAKPVAEKPGLRPPKPRRPALIVVGLSLVGWYLLYGEAATRPPLIVGAALAGALFLLLVGLAFQRVKPISLTGSSPAGMLDRAGLHMLKSIPEILKKVTDSKKRADAIAQIFLYKKAQKLYRFLALVIRGQSGKNKLYLLLLLEYVLSLTFLGSAAILFWAIATKAAIAPSDLSLRIFFSASAAYFLPSMSAPLVPYMVPTWVRFGEAITALLLFVLYVGAAASVLPYRQNAYAERLSSKYKLYRKFALGFRQCVRTLEKLKAAFS
jgi:hypothetical protein